MQPAQINYVILKKWNAPGFNLNRLIGSNKLMHTGVCECVCVCVRGRAIEWNCPYQEGGPGGTSWANRDVPLNGVALSIKLY